MTVLGIESSCDETAAAVVVDGKTLLSNVVFSSMDLHKAYGGVVPEIAARSHIESIIPVIEEALKLAFWTNDERRTTNDDPQSSPLTAHRSLLTSTDLWDKIDAIAVTYGAGLGGSLLVGVMTAKTLAIMKNKPLYAINHVEAHVYANFLTETGVNETQSVERRAESGEELSRASGVMSHEKDGEAENSKLKTQNSDTDYLNWMLDGVKYTLPTKQPEFPMLALIVSGGHSQLALFQGHFDYVLLGQTRDDAIGEAFDKVAKIIGLPYPGGPSIGAAAKSGDPYKYKLPKARLEGSSPALDNLRASLINPSKTPDSRLTTHDSYHGSSAARAHRSSVTQQSAKYNNSSYEFSFSGLKTAVLRLAQSEIGEDYTFPSFKLADRLSEAQKNDIAASFQRIAIETIVDKAILAFREFQPKSIVIAGGVAASPELRRQLTERLQELSRESGVLSREKEGEEISALSNEGFRMKDERRMMNDENQTSNNEPHDSRLMTHDSSHAPTLLFPDMKLCTDNGAMIATLGCFKAMLGATPVDPNTLSIEPNLSM